MKTSERLLSRLNITDAERADLESEITAALHHLEGLRALQALLEKLPRAVSLPPAVPVPHGGTARVYAPAPANGTSAAPPEARQDADEPVGPLNGEASADAPFVESVLPTPVRQSRAIPPEQRFAGDTMTHVLRVAKLLALGPLTHRELATRLGVRPIQVSGLLNNQSRYFIRLGPPTGKNGDDPPPPPWGLTEAGRALVADGSATSPVLPNGTP